MSNDILSKRALDILNRASEIQNEIEFCGEDGGLTKEMRQFMGWLGDHLRAELRRESWEVSLTSQDVRFY